MVQASPTQAENDLAKQGQSVTNKAADGSQLDPNTPPWLLTVPVNTAVPVISGASPPVVGSVLTCSPGTWNYADSGLTFAYQWKRASTPIAGATAKTYTTVTADKTNTISCQVTATNGKGSANATSAATVAVP